LAACAAVALGGIPATAATPGCAGKAATIEGSAGPDRLVGTAGDDVIWGGAGGDDIAAGPGNDIVCGGPGADRLRGEKGRDALFGGDGADTLAGGSGADTLGGGPDDDVLRGDAGNDAIAGADGDDSLDGGPGRDSLRGGRGADHLDGGEGDDTLAGGGAADELWGGAGVDACDGGIGADWASGCEQVGATETGQVPWPLLQPGPHQVALTFDDGPAEPSTARILDILARYGVPATFFVVGRRAAAHPDLLQRMVQEGHSVQNRTYDHLQLLWRPDSVVRDQISRTTAVIQAATGVTPQCLRPPNGVFDDRVPVIAAELGLATVLWDVNPPDQSAVPWILTGTEGGDILLLHDTGGWATVNALPAVIEGLLARGLEFVPLCLVPGTAPRLSTLSRSHPISPSSP